MKSSLISFGVAAVGAVLGFFGTIAIPISLFIVPSIGWMMINGKKSEWRLLLVFSFGMFLGGIYPSIIMPHGFFLIGSENYHLNITINSLMTPVVFLLGAGARNLWQWSREKVSRRLFLTI